MKMESSSKSVLKIHTFTTRGLPGSDEKNLGRHPHGSLHPQPLVLGTTNQIRTHYSKKQTQRARYQLIEMPKSKGHKMKLPAKKQWKTKVSSRTSKDPH